MSLPVEHCIFLPTYLLEYTAVNEPSSRIDSDAFLVKATPTQLLETILAFYPHFKITEKAKEDHELLRMIFLEMVASRLSNVVIAFKSDTEYFQAPSGMPNLDPERLPITIDSKADLTASRIERFDYLCLSYLKIGKYRLAGEYLNQFIETYEFLTEEELDEIRSVHIVAETALKDCQFHLYDSYESIEKIQLQLRHSVISPTDREDLDDQLKDAITSLTSNQKMFNSNIEDVTFLAALIAHHSSISYNHTARVDQDPSPMEAGSEHESAPPV